MRYLGCAFVLVALMGCSQGTWMKAGASEEDLSNDKSACMLEASPSQPSGGLMPNYTLQADRPSSLLIGGPAVSQAQALSGSRTSMEIFNDCMAARGYTLQRKNAATD